MEESYHASSLNNSKETLEKKLKKKLKVKKKKRKIKIKKKKLKQHNSE